MMHSVDESKRRGTRIIEGAFAGDETLAEITLPDDIEDIGEVAFFGCTHLRSVILPENLKVIREEAFGESGLLEIVIPRSVERICEKAFFACPDLRRIEVWGKDTIIEVDAFGSCPQLVDGYVARGYPQKTNPPEELLYTILWCTCPALHSEETAKRARRFFREHEQLVMEHVLRKENAAALTGIIRRELLQGSQHMRSYIEEAERTGNTEMMSLLIGMPGTQDKWSEFDL